jgi:hypothetical protein
VPIAFRARRACEIRAAKRARSSEMDEGEETSGAGEDIIGTEGDLEMPFVIGEGEGFIPFVRGLEIGLVEGVGSLWIPFVVILGCAFSRVGAGEVDVPLGSFESVSTVGDCSSSFDTPLTLASVGFAEFSLDSAFRFFPVTFIGETPLTLSELGGFGIDLSFPRLSGSSFFSACSFNFFNFFARFLI